MKEFIGMQHFQHLIAVRAHGFLGRFKVSFSISIPVDCGDRSPGFLVEICKVGFLRFSSSDPTAIAKSRIQTVKDLDSRVCK